MGNIRQYTQHTVHTDRQTHIPYKHYCNATAIIVSIGIQKLLKLHCIHVLVWIGAVAAFAMPMPNS